MQRIQNVTCSAVFVVALAIAAGRPAEAQSWQEFHDTVNFNADGVHWSWSDTAHLPVVVHNLTPEAEAKLRAVHGNLAVKAKKWLAASAAERTGMLNTIIQAIPKDSVIVIEVPRGNVWVIPPDSTWMVVQSDGPIKKWTEDQIDRLRTESPPDGTKQEVRRTGDPADFRKVTSIR